MATSDSGKLLFSPTESHLFANEDWGLIPVIGLAVPEIASTDSHDTYPACVREGPAPGGPASVYKLTQSPVSEIMVIESSRTSELKPTVAESCTQNSKE